MDKQLIERIALETAQEAEVLDADGECPKREGVDISEYVLDFAHRFLARIDAECGADAVAFRMIDGDDVEYNSADQFSCGRTGGEPLFLSPTIPEGVALVPIEPTQKMVDAGHFAYERKAADITSPTPTEFPEGGAAEACYCSMLAAAKGERNASV